MKQKYIQKLSELFCGRVLLSLLAILGCQSYIYGQENPINPESLFNYETVGTPATAALIQNIVYPVNYSTGLPEIKIPLYEVKSGDVTLPIYLTYHASGIKVNELPGWTGQGWDLVAEPMISRTIQGEEDNSTTRMCPIDWEGYQNPNYIYTLATMKSREHPDEYYYRLPNKQGMFMYSMEPEDPTKKFLPLPYEDLRIDWMGKYFKIIDDDGTTYKFGGGTDFGGLNGYLVGWRASSIVSSNRKDSISFLYATQPIRYTVTVNNDCMVIRDNFSKKTLFATMRDEKLDVSAYLPDECMQDPIIYSTIGDRIRSYQRNEAGEVVPDSYELNYHPSPNSILTGTHPLRAISFTQGKLVFTQEPFHGRLQKITVYDLSGNVVKEIQFNYTTGGTGTRRYYLESIVMTDKEGEILENYRFGYYKPDSLPWPDSRSIDYWGYYNGVYRPNDETLIPWQTIKTIKGEMLPNDIYSKFMVNLSFGSQLSREPNQEYMMYGILNKITYPTGSTDEFIYEANRYNTSEGDVKTAGGLRIKQIKTKSKDKEMKIRTFTYGRDESGNGYSLIYERFNYFMLEQTLHLGDPLTAWSQYGRVYFAPNIDYYIPARQRTFYCNPIWPITYDGGSSVMYDCVTEYNGTPEHNSGKTVYRYAIKRPYGPPISNAPTNTIQRNLHDGWKYGHLTGKTVYKNDGGVYIPLESIKNNYSCSEKKFGKILVVEAGTNVAIRKATSGYIPREIMYDNDYARTEIKVEAKLLLESERKIYTGGDSVSTVTRYEYGDSLTTTPTRIIETGSDNVDHFTTFTYPKDYKNVYPYTEMMACNILSPVVKKEYIRDGSYIGIETPFIQSSDDVYKPGSLIVRRDSLGTGDIRATYLYDDHGRVRQENRDGKKSIVYLYGYKNQHIIAQIENATYAEVVAALGSETIVNNLASASTLPSYEVQKVNSLRYSLPTARVTTYTYKPLVGIVSITDPLGLTTGYEYDGLGRLTQTYLLNNGKRELIEKHEYNYAH